MALEAGLEHREPPTFTVLVGEATHAERSQAGGACIGWRFGV